MKDLLIARAGAVAVAAGTFASIFAADGWRLTNPFFVPDLLLTFGLLLAAVLPARLARTALLTGFAAAVTILTTATIAHAFDGRIGIGSLVGAIAAAVSFRALLRSGVGTKPLRAATE
ncbi:hypothetical protein [Nocardia gipuzkoensis]